MENLPDEIVDEIIMRVTIFDMLNTVFVSKKWHKLTLNNVTVISDKRGFEKRCLENDILSIKRTRYEFSPFVCVHYACQGGHRELVEMMIKKDACDWNYGFDGACEGGHRDLAEYMIEKGADHWNDGLHGACLGGHRELAEFMIEKGADDWNIGLSDACYGGHRELVQLLIEKGANDWNVGLYYACKGGHRDLARLMIEKGAGECSCGKSIESHLVSQDERS